MRPTVIDVGGDEWIKIEGRRFERDARVFLGTQPCQEVEVGGRDFFRAGNTEFIECSAPAGSEGEVEVSVVTSAGTGTCRNCLAYGDIHGPRVTQMFPFQNVPVSTSLGAIKVTFNEPVDPATVTRRSFFLSGTGVTGKTFCSFDCTADCTSLIRTSSICFKLEGHLREGGNYTGVIRDTITDLHGHRMRGAGPDGTLRWSLGHVDCFGWCGPVLEADPAPPAVAGGTLFVAEDGLTAVAADPDRDRVWIADLKRRAVRGQFALQPGDEPGRVVEGRTGRFWVVLRGAGAVAAFDDGGADAPAALVRQPVCPEPRGIAYDDRLDEIVVACAGGELVSLSAGDGAEVRRVRLEPDLRDVIVQGRALWVSKFRTPEVLVLDSGGAIVDRLSPPMLRRGGLRFEPTVAWRTVALPDGGVAMLHQRALADTVGTAAGGNAYYGFAPCWDGVVHAAVTFLRPAETPDVASSLATSSLVVDAAVSRGGRFFAAASLGDSRVVGVETLALEESDPEIGCVAQPYPVPGEPTAVAFDGDDHLVVQLREPPGLYVRSPTSDPDGSFIAFNAPSRGDTGHALFHRATRNGIACASCHPEARDDGHVWRFAKGGPRRTQSLGGGLLATAPFHWDGAMADLGALMEEVLVGRMGGEPLPDDQLAALAHWLDAQPAPRAPPPLDEGKAAAGKALFEDYRLGCAACHSGARFTSNATVDVGTGGAFQVPSLVGVWARAPYLHDGCAKTLTERFTKCASAGHGHTAQLAPDEIDALVAYLETL